MQGCHERDPRKSGLPEELALKELMEEKAHLVVEEEECRLKKHPCSGHLASEQPLLQELMAVHRIPLPEHIPLPSVHELAEDPSSQRVEAFICLAKAAGNFPSAMAANTQALVKNLSALTWHSPHCFAKMASTCVQLIKI